MSSFIPIEVVKIVLLCLSLSACGASSNFWKLLTPKEHFESYEAELSAARAAYDRNNLDEAYEHGKRAYEMKPYSERASLLYGFINLSLAGADPFTMAAAMNASEKKKAGSESALVLADDNTSDTLGKFKDSIGLTDADTLAMGTLDSEDPELPVLVPKCAEEARALLEKLSYVNTAIEVVCPFVDSPARNRKDGRQNCIPTEIVRSSPHKAHFLWAFSHLTEALAFNSVLTYGSADGEKSNLEKRVAKLQDMDTSGPTGMVDFLAQVDVVQATVSAVMPTGNMCDDNFPTTQLEATLFDLLAVDAAFDRMKGVPPKMTKSLDKHLEKLNGLGSGGAQLKALKADLAKKMASSLSAKLDSLGETSSVSESDKESLCSNFDSISGGSSTKPALCSDEE